MSGRGQDELEDNGSAGGRILAVGWLGTLFLAIVLIAVLAIRFPEWWPPGAPIPPDAEEPARLTLSEIGTVLAGIFAPLAFLWLFVATMLQRKELELQRKELRETRGELRRTAEANDEQANLMRGSLYIARQSNEYEYFSQALYYIALNFDRYKWTIYLPTDNNSWKFIAPYANLNIDVDNRDIKTVDKFFMALKRRNEFYINGLESGSKADNATEIEKGMRCLHDVIDQFKGASNIARYSDNEIIEYRANFLIITDIFDDLCNMYTISRERILAQDSSLEIPEL